LVAHEAQAKCPGDIHLTWEEIQAYKPQDDPFVAQHIKQGVFSLDGYHGLADAIKGLPDRQKLLIYLKVGGIGKIKAMITASYQGGVGAHSTC